MILFIHKEEQNRKSHSPAGFVLQSEIVDKRIVSLPPEILLYGRQFIKEILMKKYELMTIYPLDDEKSKKGADDVKSTLAKFGAEIEEEKAFGDRDLTYQINKQKKGRFVLYTMKLNPSKIVEIGKEFKINMNLLKYQFVKLDEKESK